MNPEPFASENYQFEEQDGCTLITRITPFTPAEKSISRNRHKNAIKVNIRSSETPEQVSAKIEQAIKAKIAKEKKLGENKGDYC